MTLMLHTSLLDDVSRVIERQLGLYFPTERWSELESGLGAAARELGFETAEDFAACLASGHCARNYTDALASQLTVGETYFFRDPEMFEALSQELIPRLIQEKAGGEKRLRIWSAGCCSGEEAYSIAITLRRSIPDVADWKISMVGTDINPRFLQKAQAGIYSAWSFRGVPEEIRRAWFLPLPDGRHELRSVIREMVTFSYLNLVEDVYPALANQTNAMDLIFCRNVLMYFSPEQIRRVVGNLERSLVEGGRLVVAAAEASKEYMPTLFTEDIKGICLYRKGPVPRVMPATVVEWQEPAALAQPAPARVAAQPAPELEPVLTVEAATEPGSPRATALSSIEDARRLANQGDLGAALAACDRALVAEKLNPAHHYLRGVILQERGDLVAAVSAFQRALYLDPKFIMGYFSLGHLHLRQGRADKAERCFANARALLRECDPELALPESEGMSAGRLLAVLTLTEESLA